MARWHTVNTDVTNRIPELTEPILSEDRDRTKITALTV